MYDNTNLLSIHRASEEDRVLWRQHQRVNGNCNGAIAEHGTTILNGGTHHHPMMNGKQQAVL